MFAAALERRDARGPSSADVPEPVPEPEPRAVREDTFGGGLPLHDLEHPAPPEPVVPAGRPEPEPSGRSLEELMAAFTADPLEAPEADEEPVDEVTRGGRGRDVVVGARGSLEVDEESEVGMSLEEFEASLKRERES